MKLNRALPVLLLAAAFSVPAAAQQGGKVELKTRMDSISYALGMDLARGVKASGVEVNLEAVLVGIRESMETPAEPKLDEQQTQQYFMMFRREAQAAQQKRMAEQAERNKQEGDLFLAENKQKPGVVTTASGLQYKVLRPGTGARPLATSTVRVHYEGRLLNEKIFDSSYKRGEPVEFPVQGVISGWTEALQLMQAGAKWQLYIPANLAYGSRGAGQDIGPNQTLIFDVELLEVK
ncbi:MAG: FKBP-type peptidyl-prolyl cis-trans isomerase [Bacteroidia bacterium]|nr:FKBP-type peptidyl-prolyl cis-trans isomerase [Bacteroidia bacterium]